MIKKIFKLSTFVPLVLFALMVNRSSAQTYNTQYLAPTTTVIPVEYADTAGHNEYYFGSIPNIGRYDKSWGFPNEAPPNGYWDDFRTCYMFDLGDNRPYISVDSIVSVTLTLTFTGTAGTSLILLGKDSVYVDSVFSTEDPDKL